MKRWIASTCLAFVAACGGGGGAESNPPPEAFSIPASLADGYHNYAIDSTVISAYSPAQDVIALVMQASDVRGLLYVGASASSGLTAGVAAGFFDVDGDLSTTGDHAFLQAQGAGPGEDITFSADGHELTLQFLLYNQTSLSSTKFVGTGDLISVTPSLPPHP